MLVTKTLTIRWHNLTSRHYKSKGYKYTKQGDLFEVKVEDLTPRSNREVIYECDYCFERHPVMYSNYKRQRERSDVNKDACQHCSVFKMKEQSIFDSQQSNPSNYSSKEKVTSIRNNLKRYSNFSKKKTVDLYNVNIFSSGLSPQEILKVFKAEFKEREYILINEEVHEDSILEFECMSHKKKTSQVSYEELRAGKGCHYCRKQRDKVNDIRKLSYEEHKRFFEERKCTLISDCIPNNRTKVLYICLNHPDLGIQKATFQGFKGNLKGCGRCGHDQKKGSKSPFWKGGISPLNIYLRNSLNDWKRDSMRSCGYKCVITGDKFDDIHHLYSYSNLLELALKGVGFTKKNKDISELSESELDSIESKLIELHYEFGLGVCLRRDIHEFFHDLYGKVNNTKEEFEEFRIRFHLGELDSLLPPKTPSKTKNHIASLHLKTS